MNQERVEQRLQNVQELAGHNQVNFILTRYNETSNLVMVDCVIGTRVGTIDKSVFDPNPCSPIRWSTEFEMREKVGKKILTPLFYLNRKLGFRIAFPSDNKEPLIISVNREDNKTVTYGYRQEPGEFLLDEVYIKVGKIGDILYQVDGEILTFVPSDEEKEPIRLKKGKTKTIGPETRVKVCEIEEEKGKINITVEVKIPGRKKQQITFSPCYSLPELKDVECPEKFDIRQMQSTIAGLAFNWEFVTWQNEVLLYYILGMPKDKSQV